MTSARKKINKGRWTGDRKCQVKVALVKRVIREILKEVTMDKAVEGEKKAGICRKVPWKETGGTGIEAGVYIRQRCSSTTRCC